MPPFPRAKDQPLDYSKLCSAFKGARQALQPYREARASAVRAYAPQMWQTETTRKITKINLLGQYVRIVLRELISHEPRVMLSTYRKEFRPLVAAEATWANRELKRQKMADTLARWVLDALFSVGIMKVSLADPGDSARYNWNLRAGQPFASVVDLDDFVFDVNANTFEQARFIGHRYRVPVDVVKATKRYNAAVRKDLSSDGTQPQTNMEGDERINMLGRGYQGQQSELDPMIDCWEIWVPSRKKIYTFAGDDLNAGGGETPLYVQEWIGPACGPYHFLRFGIVPGNAMPCAPIMDLHPIHNDVNDLYRKLADQARRQKSNTLVRKSNVEDGKAVIELADGETAGVEDPAATVEVKSGGADPNNHAFTLDAIKQFSWLAGNLDAMGGLAPQARTATQDKLLDANSSKSIQSMQAAVVSGVSGVYDSLCWFYHHHPELQMDTVYELPGLKEFSVPRQVGPQSRQQVPYEDLEVQVDPYSQPHSTPAEQVQMLTGIVTLLQPLMPLLQQQGVFFDVNVFVSILSRLGNMPALTDLFKISDPPQPDAGGGGTGDGAGGDVRPGMPSSTSRTYNRVSSSAQTEPGQSTGLQQALLGKNPGGSPKPSQNGQARTVGSY